MKKYFKFKKNTLVVAHSVWHHRGGALMIWLEENMSQYKYRIQFRLDKTGKLIHFQPVQIIFDDQDAILMFKLIGFDRWRFPHR